MKLIECVGICKRSEEKVEDEGVFLAFWFSNAENQAFQFHFFKGEQWLVQKL